MHRVLEREGMGRAGIEPDVEHVVDLVEIVRIVVGREKARGGIRREPGVGALCLEGVGDPLVDPSSIRMSLRLLVHENRDRHAPGALARDHPVRPVGDHAGDAVLALRRKPLRAGDLVERDLAQRRAAIAALRVPPRPSIGLSIAMNHCGVLRKMTGFFERQECGYWCLSRPRAIRAPASIKRLDDRLVGVALFALVVDDALAGEARRVFGEGAVRIDGVGDARFDAARRELRAYAPSRCRSRRGRGRARYGRSPCRCRR